MKQSRIIFLILITTAAALASAQVPLPTGGKPDWHEVVGDGTNQGNAVTVRAAATGQPLGLAKPGHRFLAFGANNQWITLAFAGRVGFIPATAATEVYPIAATPTQYRAPGKTVEEQLEDIELRREAVKEGRTSLAPTFTNNPTPVPTPGAVGVGVGGFPAGAGMESGIGGGQF